MRNTFFHKINSLSLRHSKFPLRGVGGFLYIFSLPLLFSLSSCVEQEDFSSIPSGNVEALWRIMDEHYCFFDYKKQQLGVDWQDVRSRYLAQASDKLSSYQLFELCTGMLGELRDGHVNLSSPFDYGRNWSWHEDYPTNFSDTLQRRYLGTDYRLACGLPYRILEDNIGYVYCGTFENEFGAGNLDEILYYLAPCSALIIDVRSNGGGMITSAETLAGRFTDEKTLVGFMQHKTGPGHNAFSSPDPQYILPGKGIRWHKPVAVLTNRSVYSAANEFVKYMKGIATAHPSARISIIGDQTGGGAGMPFSAELPNGWGVRFSACPMTDAKGVSTEQGIAPDYKVSQTDADFAKGLDTIIEFARTILQGDEITK